MDTNIIQRSQVNKQELQTKQQAQGLNSLINSILDGEGMRRRFEELLGKRTPQFLSSLVTLINADINLQKAFREAPMTVIQSALKAATYDLPIDPSLGYAYIVPFNNSIKQKDGTFVKRMEATFIPGYKGLTQLCLRTGAYLDIPDAVDVREGELVSYDRLKGRAVFQWIEDEDAREKLPIIGYAGYFSLKNGAEKTIYMTQAQITAHEKKNRKGQYMGKGWREDFDAMARKTVLRRLISKYGLMSIDYRDSADSDTMRLAQAIAEEGSDNVDISYVVDEGTGEAIEDRGDADGTEVAPVDVDYPEFLKNADEA